MKKRLWIFVLAMVIAFPVVVEAQTTSKITSSRYDIEGSDIEIAEEYVCDVISEQVITYMEQGETFEVSEPVSGTDYEYYIVLSKGKQLVVGYVAKENGQYELVEITSPKAMKESEILHYFQVGK